MTVAGVHSIAGDLALIATGWSVTLAHLLLIPGTACGIKTQLEALALMRFPSWLGKRLTSEDGGSLALLLVLVLHLRP